MGLRMFCRSMSTYERTPPVLPNPNPKNFRVINSEQVGNCLVVSVQYPDCTNYEGRKTLVYENVTLADLLLQGSIDPHFCDNERYYSPVARFEPTQRGWELGLQCAVSLSR